MGSELYEKEDEMTRLKVVTGVVAFALMVGVGSAGGGTASADGASVNEFNCPPAPIMAPCSIRGFDFDDRNGS